MDQAEIGKLSTGSHKIFKVRCDFRCSDKCRFEYKIEYRNYLKYLENNNRQLCCIYCSRHTKHMGRNNPNAKYSFDDNWLEKIDSPEKAYALGWFASDSHINKSGIYLKINKCDTDVLKKIARTFSQDIPIIEDRKRGMNELSINSQTMAIHAANHLGISFGKKSYTVKFPKIENNLNKYFVRGLFEGDGSISNTTNGRPRCNISTNSKNMRESLHKIYGGYLCKDKVEWDRVHCLFFLNEIYSDNVQLSLDRKYKRYMLECKKWKICNGVLIKHQGK